jgi:hypothetical protein
MSVVTPPRPPEMVGIVAKSSIIPSKTAIFSIPRVDGHRRADRPLSPLFVLARPVLGQISNVSRGYRARIGSCVSARDDGFRVSVLPAKS